MTIKSQSMQLDSLIKEGTLLQMELQKQNGLLQLMLQAWRMLQIKKIAQSQDRQNHHQNLDSQVREHIVVKANWG